MPLHIEQACADLQAYAQANIAGALANVQSEVTGSLSIPVAEPANENYFIGEPSRFRAYATPCVFLFADRTHRPLAGTSRDWNADLYQEHRILFIVVTEGQDEQELTRACFRYAQAFDAVLNEADPTPVGVTGRSYKVFVTDVDFGITYTRQHADQRTFRKDVSLVLNVHHYDSLTQLPLQTS